MNGNSLEEVISYMLEFNGVKPIVANQNLPRIITQDSFGKQEKQPKQCGSESSIDHLNIM